MKNSGSVFRNTIARTVQYSMLFIMLHATTSADPDLSTEVLTTLVTDTEMIESGEMTSDSIAHVKSTTSQRESKAALIGHNVYGGCNFNSFLKCSECSLDIIKNWESNPTELDFDRMCRAVEDVWYHLSVSMCNEQMSALKNIYENEKEQCSQGFPGYAVFNKTQFLDDSETGCMLVDALQCMEHYDKVFIYFTRKQRPPEYNVQWMCSTNDDIRKCLDGAKCNLTEYNDINIKAIKQCEDYNNFSHSSVPIGVYIGIAIFGLLIALVPFVGDFIIDRFCQRSGYRCSCH